VEVLTGPTTSFEVRHKPKMGGGEVARLLGAIKPLQPTSVRPDPDLSGADLVLLLGDEAPLAAWEVRVDTDSPALPAKVRAEVEEPGFRDLGSNIGLQEADRLFYSGASPFARQVLRWRLKRLGITVREQRQSSWSDGDDDIWLFVRDPAQAGKPIIER